jgi:Ca2+-transporting ATPase
VKRVAAALDTEGGVRTLWWVIGGTTFFLGLVLYVPFLRDLFHFSTLHPDDLALCFAGGVLSVLWFEGLKVFKQKLVGRALRR